MQSGKDQRGIAHVVEIVIIAVIIVGVGLFIAWRVWQGQQPGGSAQSAAESALQQALAKAQCATLNDQDLCKFFTSFKAQKYSTVTTTSTAGGKTNVSTYQSDGTNFHSKMTGETAIETINIGNTVYTKDASGTWWKQVIPPADASKYNTTKDSNVTFEEPKSDTKTPQPTYKKLGVEKCGNLTCFKYQVIDPASADTTEYLWFDNKDYQLRRMQDIGKDGTNDVTFTYDKVNITAPSPTKDLAPNQYIAPGQSQPITMPSGGDLQSLLDNSGSNDQ